MWKEKIFTSKTITRGFYGNQSKISGGSTSVGEEQTGSCKVKPTESILTGKGKNSNQSKNKE